MPASTASAAAPLDGPAVIVGVDGAGRTHRLDQIAAAADRPVVRVTPPADLRQLHAGLPADALVLVDDAHRLTEAEVAELLAAARRGVCLVVARRPTIRCQAHAALDEAVGGRVDQLRPLDVAEVATLIGDRTGAPVAPERASAAWAASGGLPAIVVSITGSDAEPHPALVARLQRRLAVLEPPLPELARLLALRLELPDAVLASAAGLPPDALGPAIREFTDHGLIVPGTELMIPAVARALLHDLPAVQRRRVHESVARALVAAGADALTAAGQLRAARAYVPASAPVFAAAGDRLRLTDPGAALHWYGDALEAGADPAHVALGRAEASVLLGLSVQAPEPRPGDAEDPAAALAGAIEAHHGRCDRAAQALLGAGQVGALLAVPSLVAIGELDQARHLAVPGAGPVGLHRLCEAAITAATSPSGAVPLFIEAAEALERTPLPLVMPDTAHALGALVAALAGDTASAEHLLERAIALELGGPVFVARHRLVLAWVRMRAGRYDTAMAQLEHTGAEPGREALLRAALRAGIARRSGDIAALREAWSGIEPSLARRTVDLFAIEPLEELAVAAARMRQHSRASAVLDALESIVHRLGARPDWVVAVGWTRLQIAVAGEDADSAAAAAATIEVACRTAGGARQRAQCEAARLWARILAGDVDPDAATVVATELAAVDLPWEGSRLVGAAAIRSGDATATRRLLERARDLSSAEVVSEKGRAPSVHGGLSEREVEVARMVLAGDTYREVGARLFISPKTVEHHVARIRTKVGATSRAEFIAALRALLATGADPLSGGRS